MLCLITSQDRIEIVLTASMLCLIIPQDGIEMVLTASIREDRTKQPATRL
jgi:hypothetical protein